MSRSALKLAPAAAAVQPATKPEPHPHDVARAAYALWHAEMMLGATPYHLAVRYLYDTRKEAYDEAVATMRKVLSDA